MSNYKDRLFDELNELADRIQKLEDFILSKAFEDIPDADRNDLKEQHEHMMSYISVLMRRASRECK